MTRSVALFRALNLGCGDDFQKDYWNVDVDIDAHEVDEYVDVFRDLPWPDARFERILAQDILEHASWRDTETILREWVRVLAPDGTLELRVPNLLFLCQAWANGDQDPYLLRTIIYGGQDSDDWEKNAHHSGFGPVMLADALKSVGLEIEKMWSEPPNLLCVARKPCSQNPNENGSSL